MRILVIGCGSIGERHLRVFKQLNVEAVPCETHEGRLAEICVRYNCREGYRSLDEVDLATFDGAVICTAPSMHIEMGRQVVAAGIHVLIEKPISHVAEGVEALLKLAGEQQCLVGVGYVLRFHPALEAVKSLLENQLIGRILSARVKVGTPFDRGRPDYRNIYFARVETGGGIILDGSHEIDYLRWLMQDEVIEVACMFEKLGKMEIETEDTAEILLRFKSGTLANVHIDYIQRDYSRCSEWIGEKGTIRWEYTSGLVETYDDETQEWVSSTYPFERDDLFRKQATNFLAAIQGKEKLRVEGIDGLKTLQICLAAKRAGRERCVVKGGTSE